MPNNFRITGDYYVSKKGSNSNDGLTAETPLLTVQAALDKITTSVTRRIIIGSGVYRETINRVLSGNITPTISLVADGVVILEAVNATDGHYFGNSFNAGISYYINFTGIEFRNTSSFYTYPGYAINSITFTNCIFKNLIFSNTNFNGAINNYYYFIACQFINSSFNVAYSYSGGITYYCTYSSFNKCIFINSYVGGVYNAIVGVGSYASTNSIFMAGAKQFVNNYVDQNSLIQLFIVALSGRYDGVGSGPSGPYGNIISIIDQGLIILPANMVNNNIQGKLMFGWNGYSSGTSSLNTPISFAQAQTDYPQWTQRSFSSDPLFNHVPSLNFTLQSGSPHIKAASDYTNIGGTEYAVYKSANSTEFTSGATVTNLTLSTTSYRITSPNTSGNVQSGAIFIQWPRTRPLTKLEWVGSLDFNKSYSGGTNYNVPDWDTYTTGAGSSPDRLTVRMRFSTQQTQPATSSEWDNGGYWTAGSWGLFEINQKPKIDGNGRGNGDPAYVETSGLGDIIPSWVQFDVKLIDTYNP
jgi:hypothetical protein